MARLSSKKTRRAGNASLSATHIVSYYRAMHPDRGKESRGNNVGEAMFDRERTSCGASFDAATDQDRPTNYKDDSAAHKRHVFEIQLHPVSPEAERLAPQLRGFRYVVVEEQIALVDQGTRKVDLVFPRWGNNSPKSKQLMPTARLPSGERSTAASGSTPTTNCALPRITIAKPPSPEPTTPATLPLSREDARSCSKSLSCVAQL
jgi:hypothetical protein